MFPVMDFCSALQSYYRFHELYGGQRAHDRVRGQTLPEVGPTLDTLEEAFTSENWIVRIYKVKPEDTLGRAHKDANAFSSGKRKKAGNTRKRKNRRKAAA